MSTNETSRKPGGTAIPGRDINVLLIDASPDDAGTVERSLAGVSGISFHLRWIGKLPDGNLQGDLRGDQRGDLASLTHGATDVVLLDLLQSDVQGIGTLDRLLAAAPRVPVLVLCDAGDEDLAMQAVQRGAQDYLLKKHLDSYSLPRALRNVIDRKLAEEALFLERERAQVTLDSIGDAVLSTDIAGNVTYLNSVAEEMTGWLREDAKGRPVAEVFRVVDGTTREPPARHPIESAVRQNMSVVLAANSVLIRRDGFETAIEDSAAPIHNRDGAIIGAVIVFHDLSESRAVRARMSHLAQHDFLTDLPNVFLLNDRISQAIALARRYEKQFAVLFIDLDDFKRINDSLGHAIGDKLLQSVALRLKGCLRDSDAVSRRGGDEFVVLLSEVSHVLYAARSAGKIIAAMKAAHRIDGHDLVVTASIGIAVYPLDGTDSHTLLECADAAMYLAKKNGRDNYWFFSEKLNRSAATRRTAPHMARAARR